MITKAKRRAVIPAKDRPEEIENAIHYLRKARHLLRLCGSKNAADYVQRAIKSAEGAKNHAERAFV